MGIQCGALLGLVHETTPTWNGGLCSSSARRTAPGLGGQHWSHHTGLVERDALVLFGPVARRRSFLPCLAHSTTALRDASRLTTTVGEPGRGQAAQSPREHLGEPLPHPAPLRRHSRRFGLPRVGGVAPRVSGLRSPSPFRPTCPLLLKVDVDGADDLPDHSAARHSTAPRARPRREDSPLTRAA